MDPQINKVCYPTIKFSLNKNLDKKVCFSFLKYKRGGLDFGQAVVKIHPELTPTRGLPPGKQTQAVGKYVEHFYKRNQIQLEKAKQEFQKEWNKKSLEFFKAIDQVFNHHPWPKGPYFCYISAFPCGPRFLKEKSFQVFYLHRPRVKPIAHEILHFLFYDCFGKHFAGEDLSSEAVWILSEIVNTLALDSPEFRTILGSPHYHPYPAQKDLVARLKPAWQANNLSSFLKKGFSFIKSSLPSR